MKQAWAVLGYPRMGPRRYDLSRELRFGRPAQVGATPFADSPTLVPGSKVDKELAVEQLNNDGQPSITYVLTHKCCPCPDRASCLHISHLSSLNPAPGSAQPYCVTRDWWSMCCRFEAGSFESRTVAPQVRRSAWEAGSFNARGGVLAQKKRGWRAPASLDVFGSSREQARCLSSAG